MFFHSGSNIAERVGNVLDEWSLTDKIFSFTLDNASANASFMTLLTPEFSGYVDYDFFPPKMCMPYNKLDI
jgi:hypothetical protein